MTDTEKIELINNMLEDCWGSVPDDDDGDFLRGVLIGVEAVSRFGGEDNDK